jgi:BCD family chlorophyll transporter-like MFS transporter
MTPGQTTQLGGMQNGGVLLGMLGAAWLSTRVGHAARRGRRRVPRVGARLRRPLAGRRASVRARSRLAVFALGAANGVFTVAASAR